MLCKQKLPLPFVTSNLCFQYHAAVTTHLTITHTILYYEYSKEQTKKYAALTLLEF